MSEKSIIVLLALVVVLLSCLLFKKGDSIESEFSNHSGNNFMITVAYANGTGENRTISEETVVMDKDSNGMRFYADAGGQEIRSVKIIKMK